MKKPDRRMVVFGAGAVAVMPIRPAIAADPETPVGTSVAELLAEAVRALKAIRSRTKNPVKGPLLDLVIAFGEAVLAWWFGKSSTPPPINTKELDEVKDRLKQLEQTVEEERKLIRELIDIIKRSSEELLSAPRYETCGEFRYRRDGVCHDKRD